MFVDTNVVDAARARLRHVYDLRHGVFSMGGKTVPFCTGKI